MSVKLENPFEPADILTKLIKALEDFVMAPTEAEREDARGRVLDPSGMQRLQDLEDPFLQAALKCGYTLDFADSSYVALKGAAEIVSGYFYSSLNCLDAIANEIAHKKRMFSPLSRPSMLSHAAYVCSEASNTIGRIAQSITKAPGRRLSEPPAFMTFDELVDYTGLTRDAVKGRLDRMSEEEMSFCRLDIPEDARIKGDPKYILRSRCILPILTKGR